MSKADADAMERIRATVLERKEQQRRFGRALEVAQREQAITGSMTLNSDGPCASCGQALTGERATAPPFCFFCRQAVGCVDCKQDTYGGVYHADGRCDECHEAHEDT